MNSPHLTADELDAFLAEQQLAAGHVASCDVPGVRRDGRAGRTTHCQRWRRLPYFDASPASADRVMRGIGAPAAPAVVPAVPRHRGRVAARRRAIGALRCHWAAIAAGFVWAGAHPAEALRWSAPALQDAGHALWLSLQTGRGERDRAALVFFVARHLATPARALFALAPIAGAYAIAPHWAFGA